MPQFTHIRFPAVLLGDNLDKAIEVVSADLAEYRETGERMSEWDGIILQDGIPAHAVSPNGRLWDLTRVSQAESRATPDTVRAVWDPQSDMITEKELIGLFRCTPRRHTS